MMDLDMLLNLVGTILVLPIIGIGKRFLDQTWMEPYIRWEPIATGLFILLAWQFAVWFAPAMTAREIFDLGCRVAGICSATWGLGKMAQAIVNNNKEARSAGR